MDLNALQIFFDNNEIPKIKKKPKTFLGIAKQPHYENVLSNIYAFFFNVNEEHGMKDLFVRSMVDCINGSKIKNKDFSNFYNFDIETEYYTRGIGKTKRKGRIDLLLYNQNSAIIIENKVYHHLDNDLDDYWKSVKLDSENIESKIGILLSLQTISEDSYKEFEYKDHYINITHCDFLNRVMKNSGEYLLNAADRYVVFLKDLYQNTINLSNYMEKDKIDFYYKNQEKLNNATKLKFAVRDFIKKEIKHACDSIEGKLNFYSPKSGSYPESRLRYYVSPSSDDLMFTIIFDGLLESKRELTIIVELTNTAIDKGKELKKKSFDKEERKIILDEFYSTDNSSWAHFAKESYIVSEENIEGLQTFIKDKIESGSLLSIYKKLENHMT